MRQHGGAEIQAGMDGIVVGSTGRRFVRMPARSTAAACTGAWCARRMVPRSAGLMSATDGALPRVLERPGPSNLHILMNWQKQGADWKLLSRASTKL